MRPFVLALCVLATASAALGQQQSRFRLERIIVEGSRVDDTIVRGEARLTEEEMYGEEDFQQAVYRVRRLPFVTDATYRIEPGVTAGGTTLVIRILDVTPVFYDFNGSGTRLPDGETVRDGSALIGGRWLLNNLGVVEGAVQKSDNLDGLNVGLAYRAYNIMGTGGFGSVAIAQRFKSKIRDYDPSMAATLGYPLTQRQSVTLAVSKSGSSLTREIDLNNDDDEDDDDDSDKEDNFDLTNGDTFTFADLRWWYESIDDPIFATRGVSVSGGPNWSSAKFTFENYDAAARKIVASDLETEAYGLGLDASAYRVLFGRNVGFIRLSGNGTRSQEVEVETLDGVARAGIAHDFHSYAAGVLRPIKARLEVGAAYRTTRRTEPGLDEVSDNDTSAEAAFVLRHRWGTFRLTGTYLTD
jgi:hypothetical protein